MRKEMLANKKDSSNSKTIKNSSNKQKKSGCYIATLVYGSYDCPEVWTLRRYRDYILGKTWYGKLFVHIYYFISPKLVKYFGKMKIFQRFFKSKLDRKIIKLQSKGIESTPYKDKDW